MIMTDRMQVFEQKIFSFFKCYGKYILGNIGVGVLAYFMMMSLNLVNDLDGVWHLSNFIAGDWEISLGRGLQRYADRARFGIVSDAFNSLITISLMAVANAVILMRFHFDNALEKGLALIILTANPIVCNALSYSYMSVNFGLAYFFSVAAFACIGSGQENRKKALMGMLAAAGFFGVSMAFYQAYIGVTCVLAVICMLKMLLEGREIKRILHYMCLCAGMCVLGGMFYLLITNALLYRAGIQLASYKGAANISLPLIIKALPESLKQCYLQFVNYYFQEKAFARLEFVNLVLAGLCVVYLAAAVIQVIKLFKRQVLSAILFLARLILLPVAGCVVLLIAVGNSMTGLMSMGMMMSIVMLGVIVPHNGKAGFWLKRAHLLVLALFMWFQLSAVINDQLALKEGKTATISLADNMIAELYREGYLEEYQQVAFVGRPGDNDRFAQSTAYQMANGYAKFGCWSTGARNNRVSWNGVIFNFLGVNLNFCGDQEYQEIIGRKQVADMPSFPSAGSVCVIDDIIVIKVSEVY